MVIHNMISYWSLSFKLPASINYIEHLCSFFLYNHKLHVESQTSICRPRVEGGLGIRKMTDINKAVGARLFWRACYSRLFMGPVHVDILFQKPSYLLCAYYFVGFQVLEIYCFFQTSYGAFSKYYAALRTSPLKTIYQLLFLEQHELFCASYPRSFRNFRIILFYGSRIAAP